MNVPEIVTKIQGRGNGIKTEIINIEEIAKELRTPPEYIIKFIGIEYGVYSKFDKHRRGFVSGAHDKPDLQKTLDKFIELFVLCGECKLSKLEMKPSAVEKRIYVNCLACGNFHIIKLQYHRLVEFIIKNESNKNFRNRAKQLRSEEGSTFKKTKYQKEEN